jgi:hypothetical protein
MSILALEYELTKKFVESARLIHDFNLCTKHFVNSHNVFELKRLELKLNKGKLISNTSKEFDGQLTVNWFRTSDFVTARFSQEQVSSFELNQTDIDFVANYI